MSPGRVSLGHVSLGRVSLGPARLVLAAGLGAAAMLALAPPAEASCAGPPAASPHAFVGTVVDTREEDRIATVVTDRGRRVTVLGTSDTSRLSDSFSSVDRRFSPGGRYEFHPVNVSDPYRDNACTATHRIAGRGLRPLGPEEDSWPGWLPLDEQSGPIGYALFLGPLAIAGTTLPLLTLWLWRRRAAQGPGLT